MHDTFLTAACDEPDEDVHRLVYADWLEEQGDAPRAEHIRAQIALERAAPDAPGREGLEARIRELEKAHAGDWLRPLRESLDRGRVKQLGRWTFHRGLLHALLIRPRRTDFLDNASAILSLQPLRELELGGGDGLSVDEALAALGRASGLDRLRSLAMWGYPPPAPASFRLLGESKGLGRLTAFSPSIDLSGPILAGLEGTPLASRLEALNFPVAAGATGGLLDWLLAASRFPALRGLWMGPAETGDDGLAGLARSGHYPNLRSLNIQDGGTISRAGLEAVIGSPLWQRLSEFGLSHARVGDEAAVRVASSLARLRCFRLAYAGLGARTAFALASADWGGLRTLNLDGNPLGDDGARALAESPRLSGLEVLSLYSCAMGDAGARALAASPHAAGLRRLTVYESDMGIGAKRALRRRFGRRLQFGHSAT